MRQVNKDCEVCTKLCALDNILEAAEREKKVAIQNLKVIKAKKKEISSGKKCKYYHSAGTLKPMPVSEPMTTGSKENDSVFTESVYLGTNNTSTPAPPLSSYNTYPSMQKMLQPMNLDPQNNNNFFKSPFTIPSPSPIYPSTPMYNPTAAAGCFFEFVS
ncbi:hypothetical protein Clacol_001156 [Clathrus columnatus]|uniref:Uncharacterized protein n=1 Tax=Clathrus columnatus TaxID=1419009 RepID=A0AAV4ZXS0_9AGAM|nr:hypothetical protein Clacol_001156 [Clathrus columnatus]